MGLTWEEANLSDRLWLRLKAYESIAIAARAVCAKIDRERSMAHGCKCDSCLLCDELDELDRVLRITAIRRM